MEPARRQAIHDAMVRLSDGDRSAFDVLLDELWPVILSFARRGVASADAEDVAQEVFYRLCARISEFDRKRDGVAWALGIASYEIMSQRRRVLRRREVGTDSLDRRRDEQASQEDALVERELMAALEQAVGALSEADRQLLGLGGELSGVMTPTIRKRKQRALDRLRGLWRSIHGDA